MCPGDNCIFDIDLSKLASETPREQFMARYMAHLDQSHGVLLLELSSLILQFATRSQDCWVCQKLFESLGASERTQFEMAEVIISLIQESAEGFCHGLP